jgi:hypothetical protein
MKLKTLVLIMLLAASPAMAADVEGTWTGSVDTPNGAVAVAYTFKAEGDRLTGSTTGPDGTVIPISNGTIMGNKISFTLTLDFGGGPTTFSYTGEVSPTGLALHTSFMDMPIDFQLKKT